MTKRAVKKHYKNDKKERKAATKRYQETEKNGRGNRRLYRVKMLKYLPERH